MYKQIKPLGLSGKIQVTPEQSEVVQKALFEMGYFWYGQEKIKKIDKPYLFWKEWDTLGKRISFMNFSDEQYFVNNENPLHLFKDYFEPIK